MSAKITTCDASEIIIFPILHCEASSPSFIRVMMQNFFLIYTKKQCTVLEQTPAVNGYLLNIKNVTQNFHTVFLSFCLHF